MTPIPRPSVADDGLKRPDWVEGDTRNARLLWLDKNENRDPAHAALVARLLAGLPPEAYVNYPDSAPLYRKLAAWLGVDPRNLMLAAGSDGVIRSVFEAFVSVGDGVLITVPTFAMYEVYCRIYGARRIALTYRPSNDGPALAAEEVIEAIRTERPRLVCLANPDSPTGTVFAGDALRSIIAAAGDVGAVMLLDEAYHPFHPATAVPWISEFPFLVIARSTGKAWGVAGLRIGYSVASVALSAVLHKVRPMYECGTVGMAGFEVLLDHADAMEGSVRRLEAGKAAFLDAMKGFGFRVLRNSGNFCHVAFGVHAAAVHRELSDVCLYRRDFAEPCLTGFSRFTSTTRELFEPIIDAIGRAVTR